MSSTDGVPADGSTNPQPSSTNGTLHSKSGWDGKLRIDKNKKAVLANPEALSDPDYSDEDAPPVDEIEADEGVLLRISGNVFPLLSRMCRSARRRGSERRSTQLPHSSAS